MKIAKEVRDAYAKSKDKYKRLNKSVDEVLKHRVEERDWFYFSRIKGLESFSLKVETGRVKEPSELEDYFACTIVVPLFSQITCAEKLIKEEYFLQEKRPRDNDSTWKESSNFAFDDLRLYVRHKDSVSGKYSDLEGMLFEIQIKTILQHAWTTATHDLIYKSGVKDWPSERIAFQIKAMLEHVETSIAEADKLSASPSVKKTDEQTRKIRSVMDQMARFWLKGHLPQDDLKRLAENTLAVLNAGGIDCENLSCILDRERERIGIAPEIPEHISPYSFVVQAVAHLPDFKTKFYRQRQTTLVIHKDMDLPEWMRKKHDRIINLSEGSNEGSKS